MCQRHNLDWQRFCDDQIDNRQEYEKALRSCPECLEEYLQCAAGVMEHPSPGFVDAVMSGIADLAIKKPRINRQLIHYLVAACLTVVFLRLGAFDWLGSLSLSPEPGFLDKIFQGFGGALKQLISSFGGI